jgi:hypothetical protein
MEMMESILQTIPLTVPVRSHAYQYFPPQLQILREVVQDLLEKGIVREMFSQYASPAFFVPKQNESRYTVTD